MSVVKYNITKINVDSRYRNVDPQNIIKNIYYGDSISFINNSPILIINFSNNNSILPNDTITLSGINTIITTLKSNSISLIKNSNLLNVLHPLHNFKNNYIIKIHIRSLNQYIGNIPISLINNTELSITVIDNNNYIISLPIISDFDIIYNQEVDIELFTLCGIHIKYINASYPITYDILQGQHIVSDYNNNSLSITLPFAATNTDILSFQIIIGSISSSINGFPNSDYFIYYLNRTYTNVEKIKLISMELPSIIPNITKNNNSIYFQILDDGDYIYNIKLDPGKYDYQKLENLLIEKINNTKRCSLNINCIANIQVNNIPNIFSIKIFGSYTTSINNITNTTNLIYNIYHPLHNLNINDVIEICNVNNFSNIPNDVINNKFPIISIIDVNNYLIEIPQYNPNNNITSNNNNIITITYPLFIRLLMNYSDTFYNLLGFKNVGNSTSITDYYKIITNRTLYKNDVNLDSIGNINNYIPTVSLNPTPYILMVSDIFGSNNSNYKDSKSIFAKIFLPLITNSIYTDFIQINETLYNNINNINYLEFLFKNPDGSVFSFNNCDYSYTLEIYETI